MSIEYLPKDRGRHQPGEQARILVVDDQTTVRMLLRQMLEICGYKVTESSTGEAAISFVNSETFSLMLLDIAMPDMNGVEVLKKVRRRYSMSELPVIMVSVKGESGDIVTALDSGANDYLIKPIDHLVLCARVKSHLTHKYTEDALVKTRNELEQRVKVRTATLLEANNALEREIAERKEVEQTLRKSEERLKEAQRIAHIGVWETDYGINEVYWSDEVYSIFGLNPETFVPSSEAIMKLVHPDDLERVDQHRKVTRENDIPYNLKYRIIQPNGALRYIHGQGEFVRDEAGKALRYVGTIVDYTELNQLSEQLSYQSSHDPLSGLFNRREFEHRLLQILETAKSEQSDHVLCYLDLDQFKIINNTYGHTAGDEMLRQLSRYLQHKLRKRDVFARMGGDEFGLLLEYCRLSEAKRILDNLREAMEQYEFEWENRTFTITASIGVVPVNKDSGSLTEILSMVEIACYAAKEAGPNRVYIHTDEKDSAGQRRKEMYWVDRINRAMQEDRFYLYYQPIVALNKTLKNTHFELFIRMKDEEGNIIQPGAFLPAAERYNLSSRIDQWVVQTAFSWIDACARSPKQKYCLGINLSGQSLADEAALEFLIGEIKRKKISPGNVYFEITETAAIANFKNAQDFIKALKKMGFRFALDDFGSGLSSFSYLRNLDVDFLKIDGQFVKNIAQDKINYEMIIAIDSICKTMGKKTVAECVEDKITAEKLRDIGVDYGQGYYFGRPQSLDKLQI
jgi:diguanylate cyclase (GGDEF)-like protein/PAS domain S-box-containing protein